MNLQRYDKEGLYPTDFTDDEKLISIYFNNKPSNYFLNYRTIFG